MQHLNLEILKSAREVKIQKLESEMREVLTANVGGALFVCPFCNYQSKKNSKGSAKVFQNKFFKCFACGIWRNL